MAKLGDLMGALLADAAQARVRADLEALKIAEAYSAHELLRHLPVPRFRLPDVTVEMPVLVSGLEEAGTGGMMAPPKPDETRASVGKALDDSEVKLQGAKRETVLKAVGARTTKLFARGSGAMLGPSRVAAELARVGREAAAKSLGDNADPRALSDFEAAARNALGALLVQRLAASPALEVLATSKDLKAHDDNESVVRLRLTISEDAYEVIARDEGEGFLLTPE